MENTIVTEEKSIATNNSKEVEEHDNDTLPIVIEKQPRKKRTTQSEAQLETLRHGRERLAEK